MASQTLVSRLAEAFRARPATWVDGRELALIAGAYAWRSRVSDLRHPPFLMRIENRLRHVRVDGHTVTISEYRFMPVPEHAAHQPDLLEAESRTS